MYTASHTTDELLHSWTRIGVGRWQIFATDIAIMRSIDKKDRRSSDPFGYSNPVRLMLSGEIRLLPDIEFSRQIRRFYFFSPFIGAWAVNFVSIFHGRLPLCLHSVSATAISRGYVGPFTPPRVALSLLSSTSTGGLNSSSEHVLSNQWERWQWHELQYAVTTRAAFDKYN